MAIGAVHGARQAQAAAQKGQVAAWQLNAAYWDCLETQAHSLVQPDEPVWVKEQQLATLVTIEKVIGPWADQVHSPSEAQAELEIVTRPGDGTCLGEVVVGWFGPPGGPWTVKRTGSGASLPGNVFELPSTPL
ncbi:MAG: hypothetical protein M0Z95_24980 [Actinomycetota bacterium]|nr:hypothetical protein [Actinomycetota bacterium]